MSVVVETGNLERSLADKMMILGDDGVKLLAKKLSKHVKDHIPILSLYGQMNKKAVPHEYKASPGEIRRSTHVVKSKKYMHSWLVNVQDWRAHFLESGTKPHTMKPKKVKGKRAMAFLGNNGRLIYRQNISHPGMRGAGFLQEASKDNVVDGYVREVTTELSIR